MSGLVRRVAATLVLLVAVAAAGPAAPAGAAVERVEIDRTRFTPERVEIEVDDSVIWKAEDGGHTVSAADGSFDSSHRGVMREGDQFRWRFRVPGTYAYFCRIHRDDGMRGTVVVVDPYGQDAATTSSPTPVTAPATSSSTAPTTSSTVPTTTTTRPLATSSTTSMSIATATTEPSGSPLTPRQPPALNPATPVAGSGSGARSTEAQAAARRAEGEEGPAAPMVAVGLLVVLAAAGAGAVAVRRVRRA